MPISPRASHWRYTPISIAWQGSARPCIASCPRDTLGRPLSGQRRVSRDRLERGRRRSVQRARQIVSECESGRRDDAWILKALRSSNDHNDSRRGRRAEEGLKMRNSLARDLTREAAVTKVTQTLRQSFDRDRAKEPQHIERVLVLQASRPSFLAAIGELMQFGHE